MSDHCELLVECLLSDKRCELCSMLITSLTVTARSVRSDVQSGIGDSLSEEEVTREIVEAIHYYAGLAVRDQSDLDTQSIAMAIDAHVAKSLFIDGELKRIVKYFSK